MYLLNKSLLCRNKIALLGGLFFLCVWFAPVSAAAQGMGQPDEYQVSVQQLIDSLLKQIAVLQAQLAKQISLESSQERIISDSLSVSDRYKITGEGSVAGIAKVSHQEHLKRVYAIFPSKYDAKLSEFIVFTDDTQYFDAFVETIPPDNEQWAYGVNSELLQETSQAYITELILHELAHIVSYEEILGKPLSSVASCRAYFKKNGCPKNNSYLTVFADTFWTESDLNRAERFSQQSDPADAANEYYKDTNNLYVSGYAALSPEEDFAESFAYYATNGKVSFGTSAAQKVRWFEQFLEFKEIKEAIE